MPKSSPYQSVLLRLLHGVIAGLVILAWGSGYWVYTTYDKRWGYLALPSLPDIQGIHGTIALIFLILLPVFALYSFHIGYRRLIQPDAFQKLGQVGKPPGWIALHQVANTLMLVASTVAVITGRMMKEAWLPAGELNQPWYLAHLMAWVGIGFSIALHLLLGAKVGGLPLLASMVSWTRRAGDTPRAWIQSIRLIPSGWLARVIEGLVIGGILLAFLLPVLSG